MNSRANSDQTSGADLHLHSDCSDGCISPEELVAQAEEKRFAAIALTDHDSVDGIAPASRAASDGMEVISGVEIATPNNDPHLREVHIVGLFVDPTHDELLAKLENWRTERRTRALAIVEKLNQAGMDIRPDDIFKRAAKGNISRAHVAHVLVEKRYVPSIGAAFSRWLGEGRPAFVPRNRPVALDLISLIHRAGGVAVLAHPYQQVQDEDIPKLVEAGIDAIEVSCSDNSWINTNHYEEMAKFYDLLISGGSDYHGYNSPASVFGSLRLALSHVEALRQRAREIAKGREHG